MHDRILQSLNALDWRGLSTVVAAVRVMVFPRPLQLPPPRLRDQVLQPNFVLCARRLRRFPAVLRAPRQLCRAISVQTAWRGWGRRLVSQFPAKGTTPRCATVLLKQVPLVGSVLPS